MEDIKFESSLSQREMNENFAGFDFFDGLMEGLTEALAHSKGKATAETFSRKRSLPDVNVAEIRSTLNMTQRSFASMLGVSPRTVEFWESGRTTPTPTAKKTVVSDPGGSSFGSKTDGSVTKIRETMLKQSGRKRYEQSHFHAYHGRNPHRGIHDPDESDRI